MHAASTGRALPDGIIRTLLDDRSSATYRHLEDAVAAIEPRVTGRAFPDTRDPGSGVADSGTYRMCCERP